MATAFVGFLCWVSLGLLATVTVAVRVQLAVLARFPSAEWAAFAAGLLAAGLALWVTIVGAVGVPSPRRALGLWLAVTVVALVAGGLALTGVPRGAPTSLRVEGPTLHPTLRLALWLARLDEGDLVPPAETESADPVAREPVEAGEPFPDGAGGVPARLEATPIPATVADGYARAVDLRPGPGRPLRDWARQGVFLLLGLRTAPRDGAAPPLRVSLP